jgi:predicted dinucleotide-binding enzyme
MKIGFIGSGHVGGTLGKLWARGGHEVLFSSRHPGSDQMKQLVREAGSSSRTGSVREAAAASEVVVLATPWSTTNNALQAAGDLSGKILIDATNPLLPYLSGLSTGDRNSGGEQVASWASGARVVKAFNTIGFNIMADPKLHGENTTLLYCGDDSASKAAVHALAAQIGFDPFDLGPLQKAQLLENFALLWISIAIKHGREFAFKMIQRT